MNLLNARLATEPSLPRTDDFCRCCCCCDEEGTDVDDLVRLGVVGGSKMVGIGWDGGSGEGEVAGVAMPEHSFEPPVLVSVLVEMKTSPPALVFP